MTPELIDRIARLMHETFLERWLARHPGRHAAGWAGLFECHQDHYRACARAVIEALAERKRRDTEGEKLGAWLSRMLALTSMEARP